MDDGQHKLSRRALLGAVCASPLVPRHPELVSGSSPDAAKRATSWTLKQVQGDEAGESCACTDWHQALARFREADAVLDSARSEPDQDVKFILSACLAGSRRDALLDSHSEALAALLRSPAPDLPALAAKHVLSEVEGLDVIVPNLAWELAGSEDCLEILRRDARRLAASAA